MLDIDTSLEHARALDQADPLRLLRERFHIPRREDGAEAVYLCGNSLGLQPKGVRAFVEQELDDWARLGVEGHFHGAHPWYAYHEQFRASGARLVGAKPGEVVMMNTLTVNLHLLMMSFYRPRGERRKIVIEAPTFPSDRYAVVSHLEARGFDPADDLIEIAPRAGEHTLRLEDVEALLDDEGAKIALVMLGGVNFLTGQVLDMERITAKVHDVGALCGFDLAHGAGNVVLSLHAWGVDFACWCSYKYLNAGPGAVAGCFVHERHGRRPLPRFAGWWGNDSETRFRMQLERSFVPREGADGWQVSNPPILSLAPLRPSLDLFDEAGMETLRAKSGRMTPYLRSLIESHADDWFEIITPRDLASHGCQLSIVVHDRARARFEALERAGVVCDFREPNVIRVAPVPLYNTFEDCWRLTQVLFHPDGSAPSSSSIGQGQFEAEG